MRKFVLYINQNNVCFKTELIINIEARIDLINNAELSAIISKYYNLSEDDFAIVHGVLLRSKADKIYNNNLSPTHLLRETGDKNNPYEYTAEGKSLVDFLRSVNEDIKLLLNK